jgi:hypothetical protein
MVSQKKEADLVQLLEQLGKRIAKLEQVMDKAAQQGVENHFNIENLNIHQPVLDNLTFRLDKLDIDQLSGSLNMGNNFGVRVNQTPEEEKKPPVSKASKALSNPKKDGQQTVRENADEWKMKQRRKGSPLNSGKRIADKTERSALRGGVRLFVFCIHKLVESGEHIQKKPTDSLPFHFFFNLLQFLLLFAGFRFIVGPRLSVHFFQFVVQLAVRGDMYFGLGISFV